MDLPLAPAALSPADAAALADLYRRGTPANTIRAWEHGRIHRSQTTAS